MSEKSEIQESDLRDFQGLKLTEKPYLTRYEAAELLNIHVNTLDKLAIPKSYVRNGGRVVFSRVDIDAFIEASKQKIEKEPVQ